MIYIYRTIGCIRFIAGRDHARAGNFYGPYDAQKIFEEFKEREIGIKAFIFETSF